MVRTARLGIVVAVTLAVVALVVTLLAVAGNATVGHSALVSGGQCGEPEWTARSKGLSL